MDLHDLDNASDAQLDIERHVPTANMQRLVELLARKLAEAAATQEVLRRRQRHDVGREDPPLPPWPRMPPGGWLQGRQRRPRIAREDPPLRPWPQIPPGGRHRRRQRRLRIAQEDPPLPPWPQVPAGGWHRHVNNNDDPAVPPFLRLTFWGYTIPAPSQDELFRLLYLIHNIYYISAAILGCIEVNAILMRFLLWEIHHVTGVELDEDLLPIMVWWMSGLQNCSLWTRRLFVSWKCIRGVGEQEGWRWVRWLDEAFPIPDWASAFWDDLPGHEGEMMDALLG